MSNIPGVSTMRIFRLKRTTDVCEHTLVTDDPDADDLNCFRPRIVFPVALFPDPVLPRRTILISSSAEDSVPN